MKSAWKGDFTDFAAWNSGEIEEVDMQLEDYEDCLATDKEAASWDKAYPVDSLVYL